MKNKGLIITTIIFFILVNTTYYWEGKLGILAFPVFFILVVVCFGLVIAFFRQFYLTIKEKFKNRQRLVILPLLITVLAATFLKPFGLIDFDKLNGEDILIASREGGGNCTVTLKLKDNFTFRERSVCFGVSEIAGTYRLSNDTIYFDNVEFERDDYYKYALVRTSKFIKDNKHFDLVRFKDLNDTTGHELWITKNELNNEVEKKPNR